MNIAKLRNVTVCTPAVSLQRFEGIYCLCNQGRRVTCEQQDGYSLPLTPLT